jgi:ABC-2 type transport system ATP-binding protein
LRLSSEQRLRKNYETVKEIYSQIEPFKKRKAGKLSGGMKQKLALSCALIHSPEVLFLDEPTTGVDPVSRKEFWDMLDRIKAKGISILVSTPYMDEASRCDRVALIQEGQLLSIDTPTAIVSQFNNPLLAIRTDKMYQLIQDLRSAPFTHSAFPFGEFVHLALDQAIWPEVVENYLVNKGHQQIQIQPTAPTIEDSFMELMQNT